MCSFPCMDFLNDLGENRYMKRIKLTVAYDGTDYCGWQVQPNGVTIEEILNREISGLTGEEIRVIGASRTDSGVHAYEYCISMKLEHSIPEQRLVAALNHFLPPNIAVHSCEQVDDNFHARYSCKGKEYVYKMWNHPIRDPFLDGYAHHYWYALDEKQLNEAAKHYIGSHDFTSFCTLDQRKMGDMVRTVTEAKVERAGDMVLFTVSADGFLYNMVRIMVGTLLRVAQGKFQPEDIPHILEAKNRKMAGPTAPPCGLYLNRVFY